MPTPKTAGKTQSYREFVVSTKTCVKIQFFPTLNYILYAIILMDMIGKIQICFEYINGSRKLVLKPGRRFSIFVS